jgi:hypothetical protein
MSKFDDKFTTIMESYVENRFPDTSIKVKMRNHVSDTVDELEMTKDEFIEFVSSVPFKNYTKSEFLAKVFQEIDGYDLACVEFQFYNGQKKYDSCNIHWKPVNENKSPISLYFYL